MEVVLKEKRREAPTGGADIQEAVDTAGRQLRSRSRTFILDIPDSSDNIPM
jgi:hypothetical protein